MSKYPSHQCEVPEVKSQGNHKEVAEQLHCIDSLEYCRHTFAPPSASTAFRSQSAVRKENYHFIFGKVKTVNLLVTTNIHVPLPLEVLGSNCTPKRRSLLFRSLMSPHKRCPKIRRSKGDYRCPSTLVYRHPPKPSTADFGYLDY